MRTRSRFLSCSSRGPCCRRAISAKAKGKDNVPRLHSSQQSEREKAGRGSVCGARASGDLVLCRHRQRAGVKHRRAKKRRRRLRRRARAAKGPHQPSQAAQHTPASCSLSLLLAHTPCPPATRLPASWNPSESGSQRREKGRIAAQFCWEE
eukprot:3075192-Rhodomonas_salina.2